MLADITKKINILASEHSRYLSSDDLLILVAKLDDEVTNFYLQANRHYPEHKELIEEMHLTFNSMRDKIYKESMDKTLSLDVKNLIDITTTKVHDITEKLCPPL